MKLIKITTENQISVHDFPEGSFMERNQALRDHIGPKCDGYPILGNVLIVGEKWEGPGISFCGIPGDQFDLLFPQLRKLTEEARKNR